MSMRRLLLFSMAALLLLPAAASARGVPLPPGAAKSDNLEYVGCLSEGNGLVEGKLDRVGGRQRAHHHGPLRLPHL